MMKRNLLEEIIFHFNNSASRAFISEKIESPQPNLILHFAITSYSSSGKRKAKNIISFTTILEMFYTFILSLPQYEHRTFQMGVIGFGSMLARAGV